MGTEPPSDSAPIAGRHTLGQVIGAGVTAVVHGGRDLVTDQPVAVKLYRPGDTTHQPAHPNVPAVPASRRQPAASPASWTPT